MINPNPLPYDERAIAVVLLLCFELAVASCTPLVPFVAKRPSRILGRARGPVPTMNGLSQLYPFCVFVPFVAKIPSS